MTYLNAVTGAFGYTGKYIARRLLARGEQVRTLTSRAGDMSLLGGVVEVAPFNFGEPNQLVKSLQGVTTLYNTYWVRFPRKGVTFQQAVDNTGILVNAAEQAGVRRIVHVSITSASENSPLPYFWGKGVIEGIITASSLSSAILRPTIIFGLEDILVNNIAWLLRHMPLFPVFGSGDYPVQPVFVEDLAEMAVTLGHQDESITVDAVGPETYTYEDLVRLVARHVGSRSKIIHLSPGMALFLSRIISYFVNDVLVTKNEVKGLMSGLLVSEGSATCPTRFSDWLQQNADSLGTKYSSEVARHYN